MTRDWLFSGKAAAYAEARPGYPRAAIDYVRGLVDADAVFADIGAGTGKFTELLAQNGCRVFAVEPNADMREQLAIVLAPYPNAEVVGGSAEATGLPDHSVDVVTTAQALHWFDLDAFRAECQRICRPGALVVTLYNDFRNRVFNQQATLATDRFHANSTVKQFPNPQRYTREKWLRYMHTHSHSPLPGDPRYAAHLAKAKDIFDRESRGGVLRREVTTTVYCERLG